MLKVRAAANTDHMDVTGVLSEAFRSDPVIRWLLPEGQRVELLFHALARYQHGLHGGTDLAEIDGEPAGASLWDRPGYRQSTWHTLGSAVPLVRSLRSRIHYGSALEQAFHRERPPGAFWYLASIGAAHKGQGIGSALLAHRLDHLAGPVYLESSNEMNLPLYERFGFRVTGEICLPHNGPTCWKMLRH
ncbi:MAG: GNAT family N-acetyltransferase [Acidimicrobiales bacterium]